MSRPAIITALCLALSACAEFDMLSDMTDTDEGMTYAYRIDVYPPPSTEVGLGAQSFFQSADDVSFDVTMSETVLVEGAATGWQVTPWAGADIPGTPGGVEANIRFKIADTIQSPFTRSNEAGEYAMRVVPAIGYQVSVEPIDPSYPLFVGTYDVDSFFPYIDIDIGYGVPVYGRVVDTQGFPIGGAEVYVVHESGVRGPATVADGVGNYLLRVQPGERFYVVSEGRDGGRDPMVHSPPFEVPEDGARIDLEFPVLNFTAAGGRVLDASGQAVDSVTIRFIALEIDGTPDQGSVEMEVDVRPTNGNFDVRVLPGRYRVEVLPDPLVSLSPVVYDEIVVGEGLLDIGTVELSGLLEVGGTVRDEYGTSVPNAVVTWREVGLGERSWSATTDAEGNFLANLPAVGLAFTLQPPADRPDLGLTRLTGTPTGQTPLSLDFAPSYEVVGTVSYLGEFSLSSEPLAGAVVEIRDASGELRAITISDATGRFAAQLTGEP